MANNGFADEKEEIVPTPETLRQIAEEAAHRPEKGASASRMVGQFILFPLAIVGVSLAIYLLYGVLTREERTARDLLNEVRAGGSSRRWQAAYSLAAMLARPDSREGEEGLVPEIIRAFEDARKDDPRVRQYLALCLGRRGDRRATPALLEALNDPHDETRISAIWSLGELGDTASVQPLLRRVEAEDDGVRKIIAHTLGMVRDGRALPVLRGMLNAGSAEVRWNAALALCRFRDSSCVPVISEMLHREALERVSEMTEVQREEAMLMAIRGSVLLQDGSLVATLRNLQTGDRSLKVRQAAMEAVGVIGQGARGAPGKE